MMSKRQRPVLPPTEDVLLAIAKSTSTSDSSSKKSKSMSSSKKRVDEEKEEKMSKISNDFRCLELVLNTYRAGGKVAVWKHVCDSVQQLSTQSFNLEDLSMLLQIWPEGYVCDWRMVAPDSLSAKEWHLCIAANATAATSINQQPQAGRTQVQNRMDYISQLLTESTSSQNGLLAMMVQPNQSLLPPKPSRAVEVEKERSQAGRKSSSLSAFSASELSELQARNRAGALERTATITAAIHGGMEQLRQMAIDRENSTKIRETEMKEEKKKASAIVLLSSLTSLCDTLRSLAVSRNRRSVFITSELLKELAPSLRVSESDLKVRICMVCEEIPEFLTLLPPDNRVSIDTLRVNLHCDYAQARKKCASFVAKELARLKARPAQS